MCILRQRYNVERAEDVKFNSDRCKVLIENKVVVDKFLMEDHVQSIR